MIQLQVLNYILETKDASLIILNNLDDSFFSDYKEEFKYIRNHLDIYHNIPDKETFLQQFPNFDIINVSESSQYLIDALYKDKNSRVMASTFNNIRDLLLKNDVSEAINVFNNSANKLASGINLQAVDITKDTSRYDTYVDKGRDFSKSYIRTGFKELDSIIGGWDRNEDYVVFSARPGVGKTWLGLKTAVAAAEQGFRVGIYSGEMSDQMVGYRLDTLVSHISNHSIIRGNVEVQNTYQKYIENIQQYIKGPIFVLTPKVLGGLATVTILKAFVDKYKLDLLVVDQHSLLEDERRGRTAIERASNISRDIKKLQSTQNIPIITISQQNRNSTENGVDLTHISQADGIGQDATIVIFIEHKDNIFTLNLAKSRNSESDKKLQYAIDLDKGIFTYIPTENDALNGSSCEDLNQAFNTPESSGEDIF